MLTVVSWESVVVVFEIPAEIGHFVLSHSALNVPVEQQSFFDMQKLTLLFRV